MDDGKSGPGQTNAKWSVVRMKNGLRKAEASRRGRIRIRLELLEV
jgi:hypothetical protein